MELLNRLPRVRRNPLVHFFNLLLPNLRLIRCFIRMLNNGVNDQSIKQIHTSLHCLILFNNISFFPSFIIRNFFSPDSRFTQQELPACKPILTPALVSLSICVYMYSIFPN